MTTVSLTYDGATSLQAWALAGPLGTVWPSTIRATRDDVRKLRDELTHAEARVTKIVRVKVDCEEVAVLMPAGRQEGAA